MGQERERGGGRTVGLLVLPELGTVGEGGGAEGTVERLVACVGVGVLDEVLLGGEVLAASVAAKSFRSQMKPNHMLLKIPACGIDLTALIIAAVVLFGLHFPYELLL